MSKKWPKVICDPVHKLIPFKDTKQDNLLLSLINTREFQRLRRIKQLGLSEMVFPGANHSRFAHSIGVMHMARIFLARMDEVCDVNLTDEQRVVVSTAALLHDIGHGPFSHAFEGITRQKHERWTERIIADPDTEVNQRLRAYDSDLPSKLVVLFDAELDDDKREAQGVPRYLTQIVSSQLDADRFDYLLRDSYASGTTAGEFEDGYLVQNLYLDETYRRFYIGHKALLAVEAYIFARYHMYQTVYFHKTTRSAEIMLKLLFRRLGDLVKENSAKKLKAIIGDAPGRLLTAFKKDLTSIDYLALDDSTVVEFVKAAATSSDPRLQDLCQRLLDRRLYKSKEIGADGHKSQKFERDAKEALANLGLDMDYDWVVDTPSNTPYEPYDPAGDRPSTEIYVADVHGAPTEITKLSEPIKTLTQKHVHVRYYYPEQARAEIDRIAGSVR